MLAMECSKPQRTKIIMGKNTARILPSTDLAAKLIQTARQTRKLQRIPRKSAAVKPRLTLFVAVDMRVSLMGSKIPEAVAIVVTMSAPMRLPRKTSSQFLSSLGRVILRSKSAMTMRLLPVKSSLPATTTMARPAGKMQAPASLPT